MKGIVILLVLALLGSPMSAKTKKQVALQPHAQADQQSFDSMKQHGNKDFMVYQWEKPTLKPSLEITASVIAWDSPGTGVSLILEITNPPTLQGTLYEPVIFVPSQIVVILPNGNSYRPYSQADVLQQANVMKNERAAGAYSGYNPPPITSYNTVCSLNANTANCRTTPDQSAQAAYAFGFAIQAAIKGAIERHTISKYIKQIKDSYLTSQQIVPKKTILGYVDLYVEDIHGGPFTVRIPAGEKTYDFVFGPELITVDFPEKN